MNPDILISTDKTTREIKVGSTSQTQAHNTQDFFESMSKIAHIDTGIIPLEGSGLLALRQGLNHTQIVFQHAAGIYRIIWGSRERDPNAKYLLVAQPYRIVIGDLLDGQLLGARHFYSPVPITTADQPLYHCNVPNLNCKGYGGTGVGWICLYHTENYTGLDLGQIIHKVTHRASGQEAYNDANMSSTDGTRFYQAAGKPKFLWDGPTWEKKSKEEGFEWTKDQSLWIPILVKDMDHQEAHDPKGIPLTLEMAMLGEYHAYYAGRGKETKLKPINQWVREDKEDPSSETIFNALGAAFAQTKAKVRKVQAVPKKVKGVSGQLLGTKKSTADANAAKKAPAPAPVVKAKPLGYCSPCGNLVVEEDGHVVVKDEKAYYVCKTCLTNGNYLVCDECGKHVHFNDAYYYAETDKHYDKWCHSVLACANCGTQYLDDTAAMIQNFDYCTGCSVPVECQMCHSTVAEVTTEVVTAKAPNEDGVWTDTEFKICATCFGSAVICNCGMLKSDDTVATLNPGEYACGPCIQYSDEGEPSYIPVSITPTTPAKAVSNVTVSTASYV